MCIRDSAKHLELFVNSQKIDANESQSGHHKQNSNTDLHESEPAFQKDRGETVEIALQGQGLAEREPQIAEEPRREPGRDPGTPLGMVLQALSLIHI